MYSVNLAVTGKYYITQPGLHYDALIHIRRVEKATIFTAAKDMC